jgi:GT2 family glycosyltransferase
MKTVDTIGIVTVLYNSNEVLEGFFESLSKQIDIKYNLYVIDNSPDDSGIIIAKQLAEKNKISIEVIFNNANLGVAAGNNQGIKLALRDRCTYVLLANNDTEFEADTIKLLYDSLVVKDTCVATPKIFYYGTDSIIWYAGGSFDKLRLLSKHDRVGSKDLQGYKHPEYTNYAPTCFMLIKANIFEIVGTMDEVYFVYYDDTDFVWRLNKAGYSIKFVNNAIVQHKVSTSTGGALSEFSVYYTNRNRVYFARKNLQGLNKSFAILYIFLTRIIYSLIYNKKIRKKMWQGFKDGLKLKKVLKSVK